MQLDSNTRSLGERNDVRINTRSYKVFDLKTNNEKTLKLLNLLQYENAIDGHAGDKKRKKRGTFQHVLCSECDGNDF